MSLSPIACPAWESIRGVRFTMLYGPTLVTVLVTHEALDDIDHETTSSPVEKERVHGELDAAPAALKAKDCIRVAPTSP
jgi:hypothetical protein